MKGASCGSHYYKEAHVTLQVTALTAAAAGGHAEAVQLLLDRGAKADGESGAAALKAFAAGGHVEAVRLLLERGAKADGESGAAALRAAASDEVKALLREHGATLTLPEECRDGNVAAIAQLLDGGADVEATDDAGKTPLSAAAAGGHVEAVRLLLERGA